MQPVGHGSLGFQQGLGGLLQSARAGLAGVMELLQPGLNFLIAPLSNGLFIAQEPSVMGVEGGWSPYKLVMHSPQQVRAIPFALGSEAFGVGLVAVLPHPPHDQPQLVDELGAPGWSRPLRVLAVIMALLELCDGR